LRVPRPSARCRVRLGHLRPADEARRIRGACLDDWVAHPGKTGRAKETGRTKVAGRGPLEAESLTLQIQALARDAERPGGCVNLAAMFVQGDFDHFALDSRERRHQLVVEGDGELEAVRCGAG